MPHVYRVSLFGAERVFRFPSWPRPHCMLQRCCTDDLHFDRNCVTFHSKMPQARKSLINRSGPIESKHILHACHAVGIDLPMLAEVLKECLESSDLRLKLKVAEKLLNMSMGDEETPQDVADLDDGSKVVDNLFEIARKHLAGGEMKKGQKLAELQKV